jgi:hypothetical protein
MKCFVKGLLVIPFLLLVAQSALGQGGTTRYHPDALGNGGTFYGSDGTTTRYRPDPLGNGGTFTGPSGTTRYRPDPLGNGGTVIPPFLGGLKSRAYATSASLTLGGYPPRAECGRSLL